MSSDRELLKLRGLVVWLRSEGEKKTKEASWRRSSAKIMREATSEELESSKSLAEKMAGRTFPTTTVKDARRSSVIDGRIADKLDVEAQQLSTWADEMETLLNRSVQEQPPALSAGSEPPARTQMEQEYGKDHPWPQFDSWHKEFHEIGKIAWPCVQPLRCLWRWTRKTDVTLNQSGIVERAPQPAAGLTAEQLETWWKAIHDHTENPSTASGIPIDPPYLPGCTQEIWDSLECMDYKTFLRALELVSALSTQPKGTT